MSKESAQRNVLTNVPIVVEAIFEYLTARQLNTCAQVCKVWLTLANKEKRSRKQLSWNCFSHVYDEDDEVPAQEKCWSAIEEFILDGPIEPSCVLIFCTDSLWSSLGEPVSKKSRKRKQQRDIDELFSKLLPNKCVFHAIVTDGIVGTDNEMKTEELQEYDMAASLLVVGSHSGAELIPFSATQAECMALEDQWATQKDGCPRCLRHLLDKPVKMFNLFCPMNGINQEIGYAIYRMFQWPLVAGGLVNERLVKDNSGNIHSSDNTSVISGMAVCGERVQAASVIIHSGVDTEEEVDIIIKGLAELELPLENSVGIMYACVGRGFHVYEKSNMESGVFRKYFPNTPLLGFFGNGEIGHCHPIPDPLHVSSPGFLRHNSSDLDSDDSVEVKRGNVSRAQMKRQLAEMQQKQELHRIKHPPKLLHAYTTIMCLISFP